MAETLDLERTSKPASDLAVDLAAQNILAILRDFDSPKDAGSALTLAHWMMIEQSFPPPYRAEALAAIEAHCALLKEFVNEGWQ